MLFFRAVSCFYVIFKTRENQTQLLCRFTAARGQRNPTGKRADACTQAQCPRVEFVAQRVLRHVSARYAGYKIKTLRLDIKWF